MFDTMDMSRSQNGGPRNRVTIVFSVGLHVLILLFLVLIPLIYTEALPISQIRNYLLAAPPSPPPPPAVRSVRIIGVERQTSEPHPSQIQMPTQIPSIVARIVDEGPPGSTSTGSPDGVVGAPENDALIGVPRWLLRPRPTPVPPPPIQRKEFSNPVRIQVSTGVQQAKLIYAPTPVYPPLAKINRIQGTVVVEAIISNDGTVQDLQVVSGHPFLVSAAIDAVKRWRYRPTLLNGQPVEVITTITVNFRLGGN